jgi:hypothetical protein
MKSITFIVIALTGIVFSGSAEARQRYAAAHPDCNVLWPCDGVISHPRGERVVKAMGGFGSAKKVYRAASIDYKHRPVAHKRRHQEAPAPVAVAVGRGVVKASTGAVAYVAGHASTAFQCVIDKLEAQGYPVKEMGGYARGGHIRGSLHYSGTALDINQLARNVTSPRMPANEIQIANDCGLISGAQWRHADSGHFQLGGYDGKTQVASRSHRRHYASYARRHRTRYASR